MTTKLLPVMALATGFYGRKRDAGDEFAINKPEDFSVRWMQPIGWTPEGFEGEVKKPKGKGKGKAAAKDAKPAEGDDDLTEEAQAALDKITADLAPETVELETFTNMKDVYASGAFEVKAEDAVKGAFAAFEGSESAWNGLTQKERRERILGQVQEMIQKQKEAAEPDEE